VQIYAVKRDILMSIFCICHPSNNWFSTNQESTKT